MLDYTQSIRCWTQTPSSAYSPRNQGSRHGMESGNLKLTAVRVRYIRGARIRVVPYQRRVVQASKPEVAQQK